MGTSTSHRSPRTPEWRAVREAYSRGGVGPAEIVRRVLSAAGDDFRSLLADDAVRTCLLSLEGPAGAPAAQLRREAQERLGTQGQASVGGELALSALSRAALETPHGRPDPRDFVAQLLAATVEHLVARDLTEHVGEGAAPDVGEAAALLEAVRQSALSTWRPAEPSSLEASVSGAWSALIAEEAGADAQS